MPRRSNTSKFIKTLKGSLFKKKKRRRQINTSALPLGQKFLFKTRYFDNVELDPTTGGIPSEYVFRLNSLYDPDYTNIGHQPMGFDQIMPMYNHYTVIGIKATIIWSNHDPNYNQIVVAQVRDVGFANTNIPEIIENGNVNWSIIAPKQGGPTVKKMVLNISPSKFFGKQVTKDLIYAGDVTNNPSEQLYLHLVGGPMDTVDASPIHISILLEYTSMLTEPKQLGQS